MLLAILPDMVVWLFMIRIFLLMQWWVAYHRNRRRSCCFISCPSSLRNQNFLPDLIFFGERGRRPAGEICGGVGNISKSDKNTSGKLPNMVSNLLKANAPKNLLEEEMKIAVTDKCQEVLKHWNIILANALP